jgi:hypothetical protein
MTANEYRAICNALMSNHHEKMLESAIQRNDANAVAHETAILSQIKANI